jgi:hypothetical protein
LVCSHFFKYSISDIALAVHSLSPTAREAGKPTIIRIKMDSDSDFDSNSEYNYDLEYSESLLSDDEELPELSSQLLPAELPPSKPPPSKPEPSSSEPKCWKLRHTQCNRSHRMMVIGATDKLSCIEAYDVSV